MQKKIILFAAVAIVVILSVSLLFLAGQERNKPMESNSATIASKEPIVLPPPKTDGQTSIETALQLRRSQRQYRREPVSLQQVGQLLWAAQGITHGPGFRTAPSAGALYPLETYLVAGDVSGLAPGVYRYLPHKHHLASLVTGDKRRLLCQAALDQSSIRNAPAVMVFSAVYDRSGAKYGKRCIRYSHMEAGTAAQNLALQAVSLQLGTVVIGSFDDDAVKKVLSLPTEESPMIIMPVGKELEPTGKSSR